MRKFFSIKGQIRLLKHALKKGKQDPFLYDEEELHKLKVSLRKLEKEVNEERLSHNGGFGYDKKKSS
tara:strand:+ start:1927 stop:2127 length:201 start_codon:yes stop_codon:yes gene_type:complete